MDWLLCTVCICACFVNARGGSDNIRDAEWDGRLVELAGEGLAVFGATRELAQTCGDENPPLDFLLHPNWLPPSRTRDLLEAGLSPAAESALETFASAVSIFREHAEDVWRITVRYAHGCFVRHACGSLAFVEGEVRRAQDDFLTAMASFLGQIARTSGGSPWISRMGVPAHIIAKQSFSADHTDFAASIISGLHSVQPDAAVGMLHDLVLRVAFSRCALLAQLLAHFTISELQRADAISIGHPRFPAFEFHGAACCRRYNVLADLIKQVAHQRGSLSVRMAEVGVNNALTSEYLLARFPNLEFDGVDPYVNAADIHAEAKGRLASFGSRARLWHATSETAAPHFQEGSLDLVFIDGDHSLGAVVSDLRLWRPRVRPGGLLAGHDMFNPAFDGVLEALFVHLNVTPSGASTTGMVETIHFGPDFVWWIHI